MPLAPQPSAHIKSIAAGLGFDFCGIAKAMKLDDDARRLEKWLNNGFNGKMAYMENHFDLRIDPTKLVPGATSVITLLLNYFPEKQQPAEAPQIAKYAYGTDYHYVIREKLNHLFYMLQEKYGPIAGRGFVDSAPVLERAWAVRSGLGWIGKNGNLINKKHGSFFFIATLITDLPIEPDAPYATDFCGTCTKCVDHCPTAAILPDKTIAADRCISYLTIELKDELIPSSLSGKLDNWMFGCDVCQDVCPWNRFSAPATEPRFSPVPEILEWNMKDWQEMDQHTFKVLFKHSPLSRTKWKGIMRNLGALREKISEDPQKPGII